MKVADISSCRCALCCTTLEGGGLPTKSHFRETDNVIVSYFKCVVICRPDFSYHGYFYADTKLQISRKHFISIGDDTCEHQRT
jgi:hypothetical protein